MLQVAYVFVKGSSLSLVAILKLMWLLVFLTQITIFKS